MPASYKWQSQYQSGPVVGDASGWFRQDGIVIDAPQSLQRVLLHATAQGWGYASGLTPYKPFSAGYMYLALQLAPDNDLVIQWQRLVPMQIEQSVYADGSPGSPVKYCNLGAGPIELDMDLRRAAPPPPAPGLNVSWLLEYFPNAPEEHFDVPANFYYMLDFRWLVSEPSTQ